MEVVDNLQKELIELLMLLQTISTGQTQGLSHFINPRSHVALNLPLLTSMVRDLTSEELENLIEHASSDYHLGGPGDGGYDPVSAQGDRSFSHGGKPLDEKETEMFVIVYQLYLLQKMFREVSDLELLRLFDIVPQTSQIQQLQHLQEIQQLLAQLDPDTLSNLHQELNDSTREAEPLSNLLQLSAKDFYLYEPLRLLLTLPLKELLQLQETFPNWDFLQVLHLTKLAQMGSIEAGNLKLILAPERVENDSDDMSDYIPTPSLNLEIIEQPPQRCVYRRNVKPPPSVMISGNQNENDGHLFIVPLLVRCDTLEEMPKLINGNQPVKITSARTVAFKKLKILSTSHQLNETLFSIKFELRKYHPNSNEFDLLHAITTNPICVVSHSSQLKASPKTLPVVLEVIPFCGPPSGHTRVAILGSNFTDSPTTRVKFDNTEVMPFFHGTKTLICHAPKHSPGSVLVKVCNDPNRWSETAGTYTYNAEPVTQAEHEVTIQVPALPSNHTSLSASGGLSSLLSGPFGSDGLSDMFVFQQDSHGYSGLHYTASYGNKDQTEALLSVGADPRSPDKHGNSALHWATFYGHKEIAQRFVQAYPNIISQYNNKGDTPLHWAALEGHFALAEELIQMGAPLNQRNIKGQTPLHLAIAMHHVKIAELLINAGAQVNVQMRNGITPLIASVLTRQTALTQYLLKHCSAFLQLQDEYGDTALHWAVRIQDEPTAKILLEAGALANFKNEDGETPLSLGSDLNHDNLVPLLVTYNMLSVSINGSPLSSSKSHGKKAQRLSRSWTKYMPRATSTAVPTTTAHHDHMKDNLFTVMVG